MLCCECNKACKGDEYLDIKNWSWEKCLIGKQVLEYGDEILNATETSLNDKKVAFEKSLIYTILFVIICLLLLAATCFSCHFYYKNYRSKQPFHQH